MEQNIYPVNDRPAAEKKASYFDVISAGTNTAIACASGAAVIGSFLAGPVGSAIGAVLGSITGVYLGSQQRHDSK